MKDEIIAAELARKGASNEYIELALSDTDNTVRNKVNRWIEEDMVYDFHLSGGDFVTGAWKGDMRKMRAHADKQNNKAMYETFENRAFR
jgi:hypothetical protein